MKGGSTLNAASFTAKDSVCSSLPNASTVCRGLLDAAWWVPDGGVLDASAKNGWQLWGEENPCTATAPGLRSLQRPQIEWFPFGFPFGQNAPRVLQASDLNWLQQVFQGEAVDRTCLFAKAV